MKYYIVILLIGVILITSCNNDRIKDLEELNKKLNEEVELKKEAINTLENSLPILFEKALNEEKKDTAKALKLYENICKINTSSYWTYLSEHRILDINGNIVNHKSNFKDLFLWGLNDTLSLFYNNGKCGEWGGDDEVINIYFRNGKLLADYKMYVYNCDDLDGPELIANPKYQLKSKKEVNLSLKEENLIRDCITDILQHRLINFGLVGHAGTYSTVELKDKEDKKSLYINYYSDIFGWSKFHELKREILKK